MKKQTIITGLYLAALMVMILGLVGCAKRGNQSGGEIQTPQSDTLVQKGKDNETQELTLCTDRNEDGFFSIWRFNEKYGTICYTDLKQKKQIILCDVPNCSHDSDSCRSYISVENGDFEPMILTAENKILLVYAAQSTGKMAQIQMMDVNGDNRSVLVQLQEGETIRGGVYTDGKCIYFNKCSTVSSENGPVDQKTICKVNIDSGEWSPIYSLPSYSVVLGIIGNSYIIYTYNEESNIEKYLQLSPAKKGEEWKADEISVYQSLLADSESFFLGGCIINYDPQEALLQVTELESGKCTEIDCTDQVPAYDPEWIPNITNAYGGSTSAHYLLMENPILDENEGTRQPEYKLIDTTTGEFSQPITLTKDTGSPLLVSGEYGDYFYVITGFDSVNTSATSESGDYLVSSYDIPRYALISKSDYFSQTENLIPIENVF